MTKPYDSQYNMLLDDERTEEMVFNLTKQPIYKELSWIIVRNYVEFISYIEIFGMPLIISFDHDLGENESGEIAKSGLDCVKWLIDYCLDNNIEFPAHVVHSANPVGKENIQGLIGSFKKYLINKH